MVPPATAAALATCEEEGGLLRQVWFPPAVDGPPREDGPPRRRSPSPGSRTRRPRRAGPRAKDGA